MIYSWIQRFLTWIRSLPIWKLWKIEQHQSLEKESSGNMFTAYIIPNVEVDNYYKDQTKFRHDPNILRTGIPFVSAEEALELATKDVVEQNIVDLTSHTIIIEPGMALPWTD